MLDLGGADSLAEPGASGETHGLATGAARERLFSR